MENIIDHIFTFITFVLSSGITLAVVWFTNKGNIKTLKVQFELTQKERKMIYSQEKNEELFVLSKAYLNALVFHYIPYIKVMKGEIDYNRALDFTINQNKEGVDFNRVNMLIEMYFQEVKTPFNEILKIRDKMNEILGEYTRNYKSGNCDGSNFINEFGILHQKLVKLCEDFEKRVVNIKREYF